MLTQWRALATGGKVLVIMILVLLVGMMGLWLLKNFEDNAREAGGNEVIITTQKEVIGHVQTANDARATNAARSADQRIADCKLRSRTPELCQ